MGILVYLNWVFKLYRLVGESRMIVVVTHRKIYINFGKLRLHHTVTHAKKNGSFAARPTTNEVRERLVTVIISICKNL